jgi:hypothetical protein
MSDDIKKLCMEHGKAIAEHGKSLEFIANEVTGISVKLDGILDIKEEVAILKDRSDRQLSPKQVAQYGSVGGGVVTLLLYAGKKISMFLFP